VSDNKVLRRIFGLKRDELTGDWRKLHSEELHNLYSPANTVRQIESRTMRWAGYVARVGEERVYKALVGKPEGKRPLGRPMHRWEDGIRMDLGDICWGGKVEWIELTQERDQWRALVNAVINLRHLAPRS
jgi:hypothetical protein